MFFGLGVNVGTVGRQKLLLSLRSVVGNLTYDDGASISEMISTTKSTTGVSYQTAYQESLQFFDDVEDSDWAQSKQKVREIQPNTNGNPAKGRSGTNYWLQNHYEPDFACRHERRIGRLGDGGKWVCDPHRLKDPIRPCLVYSVGSNGDSSFEAAVKEDIGSHCEIHTFDMGNYSSRVEPTGSEYHQWGLGSKTETLKGKDFKSLSDTVKLLGHEGRVIDIFKIDCEGCEWSTVQSWFQADVKLRQVLVELHEDRKGQIPRPAGPDFFKRMYQQGYVIFHKEPNIQFWQYVRCVEYAFLLLNQTFFDDDSGQSWLK